MPTAESGADTFSLIDATTYPEKSADVASMSSVMEGLEAGVTDTLTERINEAYQVVEEVFSL